MHTVGSTAKKLTSHFAATIDDLEIVLNLRRAYFKDKPVSPDESYRTCWKRNPFTMKIVYRAEEPVGYWSLIPTTYEAFQSFLTGETSHEEMLSTHCLPWSLVDHDAAYIYVVGAVVPPGIRAVNNAIAGRVMNDYLGFVSDLFRYLNIKGLVGYPSREHGYKLLEKLGFVKSNVFVENDENQPIFFLDETSVGRLRESLSLLQSQRRAPTWDAEDRRNFLIALGI